MPENSEGVTAIVNWSDLFVNHMSQSGGHVRIDTDGGSSITLEGVNLADLDPGDFLF